MAELDHDLDDERDGADFGRLRGGAWSLADVIRPVSDRRPDDFDDAPQPNNWVRAGDVAKRSMSKLKRVDHEPGPVEVVARSTIKNMLVNAAQRGLIPFRWIVRPLRSRKMKGA
jgi:hypothetical protein